MKKCMPIVFLFFSFNAFSQDSLLLKVNDLFKLVELNSKELKLENTKIKLAENGTAIEKQNAYLPNAEASFSYGTLSNAHVWDNHFNYEKTVLMPHTSIDLSLGANYEIFNGFANKYKIDKAKLNEQFALLNYQKNKEDIQFLLLAKYLDLAALYNQEEVYKENIHLAEKRLVNIQKLIEQGLLTHNDEVRSRLQLSEINQKLNELRNNISILSFDLSTVLGIKQQTYIKVDSLFIQEFSKKDPAFLEKSLYKDAITPEVKIESLNTQIAEKNITLEKAKQYPTIWLFAGDMVSRPYLYALPPVDIYLHLLEAGIKVKYDIGTLYKSQQKIERLTMEAQLNREKEAVLKEQLEIKIHKAMVKLKNAHENFEAQQQSYKLAVDNYRVVEQKYLNKFVTITDMLDASTSLLSAQINLNNAKIAIIYQYYYLKKEAGLWDQVTN